MGWRKFFIVDANKLRNLMRLDVSHLFLWDKEKVSLSLFYLGIIFAIFCSINVSWVWRFSTLYPILSSMLIFVSMLISNSTKNSIFTRKDFGLTMCCGFMMFLWLAFVQSKSIFGILFIFFHLFIFFSLFRLDSKYYYSLSTLVCKITACLLAVSMVWFMLYLLGFPLPCQSINWQELYYYTDYYFFLLDDRFMLNLIPRFHSIFLEPGHMGTYIVLLLATQLGHWDKWYNIIMMIAMLISFSLAAYGLFVILIFLRMWVYRKKIVGKLILTVAAIGLVVGGSFIYKDGDNMLNQLIVLRLELNETGDDIAGNNRVTQAFQDEFDEYVKTPAILFGRGKWVDEDGAGNAGYKLFLYEKGLIAFLLVYLFYYVSTRDAKDKRLLIAMFVLSLANFWIRAYPLWFAFYIPYFLMAHQDFQKYISTSNIDYYEPNSPIKH